MKWFQIECQQKTGLLSNQTKLCTLLSIIVETDVPLLFPATAPLFTVSLGKFLLLGRVVPIRLVPCSSRSAAKWTLVK